MVQDIGDKPSVLFGGLSGFWQAFFKDAADLEAYYQASEVYLGQTYLDLMSAVLNLGVVDTPVFNREMWKLFTVLETELNYRAGETVNEDRHLYDMPGDITSINFMQNTILQPEVLLERGVEFDVADSDGFVRFYDDPFRDFQDNNGEWQPMPGVAWRTVQRSVGNTLENVAQILYGTEKNHTAYDDGIRRGDTLRLLAQKGVELVTGLAGTITKIPAGFMFFGTGVEQAKPGDVIQVYGHDGGVGHADDAYRDFYVVKRVFTDPPVPNQAELEPLSVHNTGPAGSTANLYWRHYRAIYFENFKDYEVDYIDGLRLVGSPEHPYPLDLDSPFVYSVVRQPANPDVYGVPLNYVTHPGAFPLPPLPYAPPYSPANPPPAYTTDLGRRHIEPGSMVVNAKKWIALDVSAPVEEGVDYTVDYLNGKVYQITYWLPTSFGKCNFQYRVEVYFSGAGELQKYSVGNVKQLSYWVPEVEVDRFTLWYNYGYLVNRFDSSTEAYKSFLLGIMYLYTTGPILQRIEAALNVAAGYPVVKSEGEILTGYDSSEIGSGVLASITGLSSLVFLDVTEYTWSEADVGGYILFPSPANAANKGRFKILEVYPGTNSALLETLYGVVDESPVDWVITHTYTKIVTTNQNAYEYPYNVPLRSDVTDSINFGVLSFVSFEPLTLGFTVTDYIEDPIWWHDKSISQILWPQTKEEDAPRVRRRIATKLYEHVVGSADLAEIGDPGLYIGADEHGNVLNPTAGLGSMDPVSIYRHNTAFVLFDQFLKLHVFYISISPELELEDTFKEDLEELILIAKPAYTYPNVNLNDVFIDNVTLTDLLGPPGIGFNFFELGEPNTIQLANNELVIGDADFPWDIGDFFSYATVAGALPGGPYPDPVPVGYIFDLSAVLGVDQRLLTANIELTRTADGLVACEGRDYQLNWAVEVTPGVPNPFAWRLTMLTECSGGGPVVSTSGQVINRIQGAYDTTLGHTPVFLGGSNPWYIRHTALDPNAAGFDVLWAALRTEFIDRPIQLTIDAGGGSYTYP